MLQFEVQTASGTRFRPAATSPAASVRVRQRSGPTKNAPDRPVMRAACRRELKPTTNTERRISRGGRDQRSSRCATGVSKRERPADSGRLTVIIAGSAAAHILLIQALCTKLADRRQAVYRGLVTSKRTEFVTGLRERGGILWSQFLSFFLGIAPGRTAGQSWDVDAYVRRPPPAFLEDRAWSRRAEPMGKVPAGFPGKCRDLPYSGVLFPPSYRPNCRMKWRYYSVTRSVSSGGWPSAS